MTEPIKRAWKGHWVATERDRKNQRLIVIWTLAWVIPFLVADAVIDNGWIENDLATYAIVSVVTLIGVAVLFAFGRFLRQADELMRKIQLDALALTVGVGIVAGFSYTLLAGAGLVDQAEAMTLVMIMTITYVVGVIAGYRRYA